MRSWYDKGFGRRKWASKLMSAHNSLIVCRHVLLNAVLVPREIGHYLLNRSGDREARVFRAPGVLTHSVIGAELLGSAGSASCYFAGLFYLEILHAWRSSSLDFNVDSIMNSRWDMAWPGETLGMEDVKKVFR